MRKLAILAIGLGLMGCNGNIDDAALVEGVDGQRCTAKILAVADTGETINEDPVAQLTLRVAAPGEPRDFETTIEATVSREAFPRAGDAIAVACDPARPEETQLIED